jgi:subtilisin family serine protease
MVTPRSLHPARATALAITVIAASAISAHAETPAVQSVAGAIPGSYIVVLKDNVSISATTLTSRYGGTVTASWQHALNGFAARMSAQEANTIAADPSVSYIQQDAQVHLTDSQQGPPSWGLDRIDQRQNARDNRYKFESRAPNVHAYVIDTGIRTTHTTFGGRASWGTNTTGDNTNTDCNGHGTHVAGTVGGAEYGAAKGVSVVAVKVLGCSGSGSISGVISGVDWVTANAARPAVANMSLGGGANAALDQAVRNSINSGITYAIASGNFNADACGFSPSRVTEALIVNNADINDRRAGTSDFGGCTDLFAPGTDITSAWNASDTASNTISGTSMASPHVAGAAALWLADHPYDTPGMVANALLTNATPGLITDPVGSPNLLLYAPVPDNVTVSKADYNADGRGDIALNGVPGWSTIPTAFSVGNGTFNVTNAGVPNFATWSSTPGVTVLTGDFNADGRTDIAALGVNGWTTVPIAFSNGNGTYTITNVGIPNFGTWATTPGAKILTGDFNGDGRTDIALAGGNGWTTVPIAFSNGNGSFTVTNAPNAYLPTWANTPNVKIVTGDVNGDGRTDITLTGINGWTTIPVGFSNGDGTFGVTNSPVANFPIWAATPNVKLLTGDFNHDNRLDLALTGVQGWTTVPIAFSNGNGTFTVTNVGVPNFGTWATTPGVRIIAKDYNGDGSTDILLTGGQGWSTVPVAFANGGGSFVVTNAGNAYLPSWAQSAGVELVARDFNGDGRTDLGMTGVNGWTTVPIGFSNGDGTFGVTNSPVANFPVWAATPGALIL